MAMSGITWNSQYLATRDGILMSVQVGTGLLGGLVAAGLGAQLEAFIYWMTFCGTAKEAKKYKYKLMLVSSTDRAKFLLTGERECVSCEVTQEEVKGKASALLVPQDILDAAEVQHNDKKGHYWKIAIKKK